LVATEDGTLICEDCGAQWAEVTSVCPICGAENDAFTERCASCSETLNVVDRALSRQANMARPRFLQEARKQAAGIRAREEASSQRRFAKLVEADRERKEAIRRAQEEQELQEQQTLSATLTITAVFLAIIVIATLILAIRG
jgi:hypothetical protein